MNNSTIDWNGKLEAVHEDGRVVPVTFAGFDSADGEPMTADAPYVSTNNFWYHDGRDFIPGSGWTIRNVATPQEAEPIKWGEPIKVDGKRPDWLQGCVMCDLKTDYGWTDSDSVEPDDAPAEDWAWDVVTHIRLPHDHPHYATQQTTPAVPQEVVERMVKLCKGMAADSRRVFTAEIEEARAIVAMLEPVDGDEAIAVQMCKDGGWVTDGKGKELVLAAIKKGRDLALADKG